MALFFHRSRIIRARAGHEHFTGRQRPRTDKGLYISYAPGMTMAATSTTTQITTHSLLNNLDGDALGIGRTAGSRLRCGSRETFCDRIVRACPTFPRSDDNKNAVQGIIGAL